MQNDNLTMIEILQKAPEKDIRKLFSIIKKCYAVNDKGALARLTSPYCNICSLMNKIFIEQIKEAQNIIVPTTNILSIIRLTNSFKHPTTFGTIYVGNAKSQVLELSIKSTPELQENEIKVLTIVDINQMLSYSIIPLLNKFIKHLKDANPDCLNYLNLCPSPIETGSHPKAYTYIDNKCTEH